MPGNQQSVNVVTIAGSDPSSEAGIQGDLQTILAHDANPLCVLTAITAQNSKTVSAVEAVERELLVQQLNSIEEDFEIHGIKIGLLPTVDSVKAVAVFRKTIGSDIPLVADPVLVASTGITLVRGNVRDAFLSDLLPICTLITPNAKEAEQLTGRKINSPSDAKTAGAQLVKSGANAVLIKGGHFSQSHATDVLVTKTEQIVIEGESVEGADVHGTGCALASAIACRLAKKQGLESAIRGAKEYVTAGIRDAYRLGEGSFHFQHFPGHA